MKEKIGKRIAEIRNNMGLNKEQFAKLIGISGQYLGTVENGINGLSLGKLITLCEKTNTSADYILFGRRNFTEEDSKNIFDGINKDQITPAFEILQNIALFIKQQEENEDLEEELSE